MAGAPGCEGAQARVFLGLGSNLGDREALLGRARALLAALPGTTLAAQSGLYETAPVGGPEQGDFLNQVVELRPALPPRGLPEPIGDIEAELGRVRLVHW